MFKINYVTVTTMGERLFEVETQGHIYSFVITKENKIKKNLVVEATRFASQEETADLYNLLHNKGVI